METRARPGLGAESARGVQIETIRSMPVRQSRIIATRRSTSASGSARLVAEGRDDPADGQCAFRSCVLSTGQIATPVKRSLSCQRALRALRPPRVDGALCAGSGSAAVGTAAVSRVSEERERAEGGECNRPPFSIPLSTFGSREGRDVGTSGAAERNREDRNNAPCATRGA